MILEKSYVIVVVYPLTWFLTLGCELSNICLQLTFFKTLGFFATGFVSPTIPTFGISAPMQASTGWCFCFIRYIR